MNTVKLALLNACPDCLAAPGQPHGEGCDVERCSVCGLQRLCCGGCAAHDPAFARWTGLWPGSAEAAALGTDLNSFYRLGLHKVFFIKPASEDEGSDALPIPPPEWADGPKPGDNRRETHLIGEPLPPQVPHDPADPRHLDR